MSKKQQKEAQKPHVLVVDDDARICDLVSRYLKDQDFVVITAQSAAHAQGIMQRFSCDVMVVDVMMPDMTGTEFTRTLREQGVNVPILLLTALGEAEDRISGLESGADDYLSKPFEPKELVLRLRAILRRSWVPEEHKSAFMIGQWRYDPEYMELVSENGQEAVRLTSVEANLMGALCESAGHVVSREELASRCGFDAGERTIDVQVTRLRRKIEENTKSPRYLQTVRGKGYLLRAEKV